MRWSKPYTRATTRTCNSNTCWPTPAACNWCVGRSSSTSLSPTIYSATCCPTSRRCSPARSACCRPPRSARSTPRPSGARRCTSRCMARRPISPARAWPIQSPCSLRSAWRCAIRSTWLRRLTGSTRRLRRFSPKGCAPPKYQIVDDMIGLLPSMSSHEVDNRIGAMLLKGLDLRIAEISREQTFGTLQDLELIALDVDLQYQRLASKRKRLVQRNDVDLITVLVRRHDRRQRAEA